MHKFCDFVACLTFHHQCYVYGMTWKPPSNIVDENSPNVLVDVTVTNAGTKLQLPFWGLQLVCVEL